MGSEPGNGDASRERVIGEVGEMRAIARILGAVSFAALALSLGRWLGSRRVCWPVLTVGVAAGLLAFWFARWCVPPDNHVAVIYRLGRFHRLVGPDQMTWLWPFLERARATISLAPRRQEMALKELPTQDGLPLDLRLTVCYQRDLRVAPAEFVTQALFLGETAWDLLVQDGVQEIVRQELAARPGAALLGAAEQIAFRTRLSAAVAERLRPLGIVLEPRTGLSILDIRPSGTVWRAMVDQVAAGPLGEAARRRVSVLLREAEQQQEQVARTALLLASAAGSVRDGAETQLVVGPAVPIVGPGRTRAPQPWPGGRRGGVASEEPSTRAERTGGGP